MATSQNLTEKIRYDYYVSIHPNKAVQRIVKQVHTLQEVGSKLVWLPKERFNSTSSGNSKPKIERKFHNFQISANSRKNLIEKVLWLNQFAKSRTIKTYSGKYIYNFRTSFITLTLPASQRHNTATISNECFDRFLTTLRNRLKMTNYVWKLEFQSNGNVHYHLLTDTYVDYFFALKHWNNIIEKLGYVSEYQSKMQSLSFAEYRQLYNANGSTDIKTLASRFAKGKRENWKNPNSVDVRAVRTNNNLHFYLSKYFAKTADKPTPNELDNEENSFGLRLCFWSRSLSKVGAVSMPEEFYRFRFSDFFEDCKEVISRVYDYCRVAYFSLSKLDPSRKRELYMYFDWLRRSFNYQPCPV